MVDSGIINLSQVTLTKLTDITPESFFLAVTDKKKQAKIKILNERNAVNRFMLEFAELERESVFDEVSGECMVSIKYDEQNENEIIIRLLSFGPVVEVLSPYDFRRKIKERVDRQLALMKNRTKCE